MGDTVGQHLRDELGKAKGLANPKNFEEGMQLRTEINRLKAIEVELRDKVDKLTKEKDIARSSVAALQARHRVEHALLEQQADELKTRLEREVIRAAYDKVAEIEARRLMHVQIARAREAKFKALVLECRLEFTLADQRDNKPESQLQAPNETPASTKELTAAIQIKPTSSASTAVQAPARPKVAETKGKTVGLSPVYESKMRKSIGPAASSKLPGRLSTSSASSSKSGLLSSSKRKKQKRDTRSEDEDDDTGSLGDKLNTSTTSTGSKKQGKPRYSTKGRPSGDAFAAFDLTKRLAAPKLKSN